MRYYVKIGEKPSEITLKEFQWAEIQAGFVNKGVGDTATSGFIVGPVVYSIDYKDEIASYENVPVVETSDAKHALDLILAEYLRSCQKHQKAFHSTHEGYAVIKEELEELWEEVKVDDFAAANIEAAQVGAMALKFLLSNFPLQLEKHKI